MSDKEKHVDADATLIKSAGATIAKVVLYIGICITAGIIFTTCGIEKEGIQECKSACGTRGMVSVSMWSCQCGWSSSTTTDWVIPRGATNSKPK